MIRVRGRTRCSALAGLIGLGACFLVLLPSRAAGAETAPAPRVSVDRLKALQPGVAQITTAAGTGSGFLVRRDGLFITAFHVIAGARSAWAHFPSGEACEVEGVVASRPELDLAVLKLRESQLPKNAPLLVPAADIPATSGGPVAAIGYPGGKGPVLIHGNLLREPGRPAGRPLPLDAPVRGGCSGGPVVNAAGETIGVVTSSFGSETGFAADLRSLLPLPAPGTHVTSLVEANREQEESGEQEYSRGLGVLRFWHDRKEETAGRKAALEWALQQFVTAARRDPARLEALISAGLCCAGLKQYPKALVHFQAAREAASYSVVVRHLLAAGYATSGRMEEAIAEARRALAIAPEFTSCRRALAAYHAERREFPQAIHELRTVLEARPENTRARMELGDLLVTTGKHAEAAAEYQKLVDVEPENGLAHRSLGATCTALKRYPQAIQALRTAVRLRPLDPRAQFLLGLACAKSGDRAEAERLIESLSTLDAEQARRLKQLLKQ